MSLALAEGPCSVRLCWSEVGSSLNDQLIFQVCWCLMISVNYLQIQHEGSFVVFVNVKQNSSLLNFLGP